MDVATALTISQTLFATLQCAEVRKLCSICNYESELQKLVDTVNTIKNFLLDADSKCQELTNEGQYWVQNLKDAVYDADDLLDEFNTVAHQLKRMPGGKIMKKVRRFFSSNNQLMFAVNKSKEIKNLTEKLGRLAKNHSEFGFSELYKPSKIREETCSYVYEQDIIGRDADKEAIVNLLLQDDSENSVSFVTIVGIGGLGKTTLAQLVYNNRRIKEAFKENMYWVCVSLNFDTKDILGEMISEKGLTLEDLQKKVRSSIEGKRYLLVLDDVWSESGREWDELRKFLILGGRGTRILVTSRSKKVAGAIGDYPIHELQGLSVEDSWVLFKNISLGQREDEAVTELVAIGEEIVRKCANVPLSIRVIASLLRNQDYATWQSFRCNDLANMCGGEDSIMPSLMFSYYHLAPELKSCFSFCSLFPEDYKIEKTRLIQFWMAQGYLVPSDKTESMEDVGEKYLSILLHRCFFQDIKKDEFGEVKSFKMHDLMHELARKVGGKDCTTLRACTNNDSEGKHRHLFIESTKDLTTWIHSSNCPSQMLRTTIVNSTRYSLGYMDAIISNSYRLRVLDLGYSLVNIRKLPDRVGKLLHLRYLDLSRNDKLEMLPNSITKLHNLQTLKLAYCSKLKELPEDTGKLVNLRVLDINRCRSLSHMPGGMGTLTCLHTLTMFKVSGDDGEVKKGKLTDLIPLLNNLRGQLLITHNMNSPDNIASKFVELKTTKLTCEVRCCQETVVESLVAAFQCQELKLQCAKMPSWPSGLVSIQLINCKELEYLPSSLSQLCHLKYLVLFNIWKVEYIVIDAPSPLAKFFPSLEKLELRFMPELKGWMDKEAVCIPSFPRLCYLKIECCRKLRNIPPCPQVKELYVCGVNEALANSMKSGIAQSYPISLESLVTDNSCIFNSLGREFVAKAIELSYIENMGTNREGFQICASSLQNLCIKNCRGLENSGIDHLTNLISLKIYGNLEEIPWKSLHSLSSLIISDACFNRCFEIRSLPKGIQYLTSLQSLFLDYCSEITSLPEEMRCLTSLITLEIQGCDELKSLPEAIKHLSSLNKLTIAYSNSELKHRCRKSDGEDWHKICHIPNLHINNYGRMETSLLEMQLNDDE